MHDATDRATDHATDAIGGWAASGAMALTGRPAGPALGPPAPLVGRLRALGDALRRASGEVGAAVAIDALQLLGERAALAGLTRGGDVSCGRATRLLAAADGWVALSLARDDDVALVPAWLEFGAAGAPTRDDVWTAVRDAVRSRPVDRLDERAALLGLPLGHLPDTPPPAPRGRGPFAGLPVHATPLGTSDDDAGRGRGRPRWPALVVDLSSLWAGPLCTSLLQSAGARVVKVESVHRPDGARHGPARFFDLLNGGKASVALDLATGHGVGALRRLVAGADVVVEASRPRALAQLGIDAPALLRDQATPRVWLSITGHGRDERGRDRVAFGDDAAVAGGLVVRDADGPCFCADAIADPVAGVVAAVAALRALTSGGRWLVDVALAGVAAHLAGDPLDASSVDAAHVAPPRARPVRQPARPLGADTGAVLAG